MKKLVLGGLVLATTAALSVPVIGLAGGTSVTTPAPFRAPTAAADEALPIFEDCEALLDWYVEEALPLVGPWGFGHPFHGYYGARDLMLDGNLGGVMESGATQQRSAAPAAADKAVTSSETGTNVQEQGVDEPDNAKTDGDLIVRVFDRELIVTDITGDAPEELSRVPLPKRFYGEDLLLVGETAVVTGLSRRGYGETSYARDLISSSRIAFPAYGGNAELLVYSLEDPERPTLESRHEFEGTLVEARQYDETLRVVLQSGLPPLDFVEPNRRRTEKESTQENRDIVRASVIEDWIPGVRDGSAASEGEAGRTPLFGCDDVRHPRESSGFGTLSVVTFGVDDPTDRSVSAVTTGASLAYSSLDRLYVATPVQRRLTLDDGWWGRGRRALPEPPATTEVHSFALTADGATYVASGTVRGSIRDRWSMDEYDGDLRVATALGRGWSPTDNGVTVLRENGSDLEVRGSVRGLGPREDIKSVRWFDDLAVVVTFRQVDPLYTVDLSDPDDPRVLGELKIPGFSSYLHPIGDDQLLGLGTAATMQGRIQGAQLATFDISDLKNPDQLSVLRLGRADELVASYDPRGFTFVGGADRIRTAYTTVSNWNGGTRVVELAVTADGTLTQVEQWPARHDTRILPIDGDRVAFVGKVVRLIER